MMSFGGIITLHMNSLHIRVINIEHNWPNDASSMRCTEEVACHDLYLIHTYSSYADNCPTCHCRIAAWHKHCVLTSSVLSANTLESHNAVHREKFISCMSSIITLTTEALTKILEDKRCNVMCNPVIAVQSQWVFRAVGHYHNTMSWQDCFQQQSCSSYWISLLA
jgi:hypothetical protein